MIYCYTVRTISIDYCVEVEDLWFVDGVEDFTNEDFDREIQRIKDELPQDLELEITCEPEDLDEMVGDAIAEEVGWLINGCEYEVISKEETFLE